MEITVIVIVVLLLAGLVVWWALQRGANAPAAAKREDRIDTLIGWPPQATRILTTAERLAYSTLTRAMPGYMILAQVPLARFTRVPMRNSYAEWLRRIGSHCADLVVCDMSSQVIGVVHVRPAVGESNERARRRLARMARVLKAEGIALHTWIEGAFPTPEGARMALLPPADPTRQPAAAPGPVPGEPDLASRAAAEGPSPFEDAGRDSTQDERIEMRDAPPTTWYDDLDTSHASLEPEKPKRR
jgi:Protein of unknown function (DUF2726)